MRIRTGCWIVLAVAIAGPAWAGTQGSITVQLNIGNAPPPPVLVYEEPPPLFVVPRSTVYVVRDRRCNYDFFRFGVYWYIWNDGYWYRARTHRGPFIVIQPRYVPTAVWNVPSKHWKRHPHGGPPGLAKKKGRDHYYVAREKNGHGHGREDD